jgi:DNA-binding NtrC family response regulator
MSSTTITRPAPPAVEAFEDECPVLAAAAPATAVDRAASPAPAPAAAEAPTMLGNSEPMRRLYHLVARVAPTHASVLLVGESGTGKELVAHNLHRRSRRRNQAMIAINCGAIPENLIESELFGHEKGAFTGAARTRKGVFERAHGGTLFLDEITEMPIQLQVRLLRVLETGRVTRVGGEEEIAVDVRVIAATNREPAEAVADDRLRRDLLYRLSVFPIHLPPLRDRGDDVVLLAEHFLSQHNRAEGTAKRFAPDTIERLQSLSWPGNVRQLKNVIFRAFILADEVVEPQHLPRPSLETHEQPIGGDALTVTLGTTIADVERRMIEATLDHFDGDKKRTSDALGISLKTLYNRLNAYSDRGSDNN